MRVGLCLAAVAVALPGAAVAQDEVRYRMRANDTLSGLAARYMLHPGDYRIVQRLNRIAAPDRISPRTELRIPRALLRTTPVRATVLSFSGAVTVDAAGTPARAGMTLGEGARLQTGANAFLTLRAADGSRVSMPSQSVLRIARMRRVLLTGSLDQDFAVERGRAETRVMPQTDPASRYRLRTPIAVSAVRGTEFRVAYGDGPSLTEVLGGHVVVGAPDAAAPASIPPGVGAAVSPGGALATEKLLPPPALAAPLGVQGGERVAVALTAVPGAVRYHVQLARDAQFEQVFADAVSATPAVTFDRVPDGALFARATAIAASRFEGLPAVYPFERRLHAITAGSVTEGPPGTLMFRWTITGAANAGHFQLFGATGDTPLVDRPGLPDANARVHDVPPGTYRWRVGSTGPAGEIWTPLATVTVAPRGK